MVAAGEVEYRRLVVTGAVAQIEGLGQGLLLETENSKERRESEPASGVEVASSIVETHFLFVDIVATIRNIIRRAPRNTEQFFPRSSNIEIIEDRASVAADRAFATTVSIQVKLTQPVFNRRSF